MLKIDALGKACPIPVIETKKALKSDEGKNGVVTLVDNEIATQNLTKMAQQLNLSVEVEKIEDRKYEVRIGGNGEKLEIADESDLEIGKGYVVAISSDEMGIGEKELGSQLMNSFIYALTEQDTLPLAVVFYNSGVKVTSQNTKAIEDLKKLKEAGVEIYSCGLCLNYYKLTDDLKIGEVTNMYKIVELMRKNHVVRP